MGGEVACFCGWRFTFDGNEGHCPHCGTRASLVPDDALTPEEESEWEQAILKWLANLPVYEHPGS